MNRPTWLIGGGYDKHVEFDDWIKTFDGKVKWIVLIGATAQQIDECDVYVVDPRGYEMLTEMYRGTKEILPIFLDASVETRRRRMQERGDTPQMVRGRISNDRKAFHKMRSIINSGTTQVLPIHTDDRSIEEVCNLVQEYDRLISSCTMESSN